MFSTRAGEIAAEVEVHGVDSYRARNVAARETRSVKRHTPVGDLMPGWQRDLEAAGHPVRALLASIERSGRDRERIDGRLSDLDLKHVLREVTADDGPFSARKVFARRDVIVAVAPMLFGREPSVLGRVVTATLADCEIVPLVGVAGARERPYALATTPAVERAIVEVAADLACREVRPHVRFDVVVSTMFQHEGELGHRLTAGQRSAVEAITGSRAGLELVVGVAGSGKTTALGCVRDSFEACGYRVLGTSTAGQAARTLGADAGIDPSSTLASLAWRLDHGREHLDDHTVIVLDEAAMTSDPDLLRLLAAARAAQAKVVMVGDDRQLGAVGPGGAFGALQQRAPELVHALSENVRQHDVTERLALEQLRAGNFDSAVDWYERHGRMVAVPKRFAALDAVVAGWVRDVEAGRHSEMYAWRRANVEALNQRAREMLRATGTIGTAEIKRPAAAATRSATASLPSPRVIVVGS